MHRNPIPAVQPRPVYTSRAPFAKLVQPCKADIIERTATCPTLQLKAYAGDTEAKMITKIPQGSFSFYFQLYCAEAY